jgi:hypothetical protein
MLGFDAVKRIIKQRFFAAGLEVRRIRPPKSKSQGFSFANEELIVGNLLEKVQLRHKFVVDIGAGDGQFMSNSYNLFKSEWKGAAFELSGTQFASLAYRYAGFPNAQLLRVCVTPGNVNQLLTACDVPRDFGFLSLDIDSYDYFVLKTILSAYRPSVICSEINEKIPPPLRFAAQWHDGIMWGQDFCYGQSLSMLEELGQEHGYDLVDLEFNNAFLVPHEMNPFPRLSAAEAWRKGYVNRPDRLERLPWNRSMDPLINMGTNEAKEFLREKFKQYDGHYILE